MVNSSGAISEQIYQLKQKNYSLIRQLIHEGQKDGDFKKNIDSSFLMMTLSGTASQLLNAQHYYRRINNLESLPDEEFEKHIKKKLSNYLKNLFKAVLTYEG
jgi:hypothetical protein